MRVLRRLAILAGITFFICIATMMLVDLVARSPVRRRRERDWAAPRWGEVANLIPSLALIAAAAVVGRKVFRLRL
jgi:hypothetical protein